MIIICIHISHICTASHHKLINKKIEMIFFYCSKYNNQGMTGKQLNALFERLYRLNEELVRMLESYNNDNLNQCVMSFMKHVRTEDAWTKSETQDPYFEAGYHDSIRVFYPFKDEQTSFDKNELKQNQKLWKTFLQSVANCSIDKNMKSKALEIECDLIVLFASLNVY